MKVGDLFAGIGGLSLGLERAGMEVVWQVEKDKSCRIKLEKQWPHVKRYEDIKTLKAEDLEHVDLICGGDPCPFRSKARSIHGTKHEDLWPQFLRIVGIMRPVWVLREHVVSNDADVCWAELVALGYNALILETNSAEITDQNRQREYIVGVLNERGICLQRIFHNGKSDKIDVEKGQKEKPYAYCLTTRAQRYDSRDNYILERGRGTRVLVPEEYERLQGFDGRWTSGFSKTTRYRMMGNAANPIVVEWIARRIKEEE